MAVRFQVGKSGCLLHSTTRVECILPKFEGGFAPEGTDPRESGNDYGAGKEGPQPLNSATAQRRRIPKCSVRMGGTFGGRQEDQAYDTIVHRRI